MRPTFVTLLLACLFVLVPPSQAQWIQTNFAFDGFLRCLTTSGTTLWAGTDSGVYRSTNSGTDWTIVNNGLSNTNITSLGSVGGTLFAATSGGPTFRSTNNGEVWTPLSTCFTGTISAFAASGSSLFAGSLGVCLTSDGGEHWSLVNAGLSSRDDVSTFATNHSGLYLGTFRTSTHPVYWLPENDTNWIAISGNLPTPVYIASLAALDACS